LEGNGEFVWGPMLGFGLAFLAHGLLWPIPAPLLVLVVLLGGIVLIASGVAILNGTQLSKEESIRKQSRLILKSYIISFGVMLLLRWMGGV
jgi:uncharacterized protein YhhL (DUF1145 family)